MRSLRAMAVILGLLVPLRADAAPPPLRPLDVQTIYALSEQARALRRQLPRTTKARKLRTTVVVIDPGHGGANHGAIGVAMVREKQLTLDLAYALRAAIEAKYPDTTVLLTRYWDREVDLKRRTQWANEQGAQLFLSLHYNAAGHDRALGYETFYLADETMATTAPRGERKGQAASKVQKRAFRVTDRARERAHAEAREELAPAHAQSRVLAAVVQDELAKRLPSINRGVKQANFAVLRGARMPAVVIESGFLTHPDEGRDVLGTAHRQAVVAALLAAIEAFDKQRGKPQTESASARLEHQP